MKTTKNQEIFFFCCRQFKQKINLLNTVSKTTFRCWKLQPDFWELFLNKFQRHQNFKSHVSVWCNSRSTMVVHGQDNWVAKGKSTNHIRGMLRLNRSSLTLWKDFALVLVVNVLFFYLISCYWRGTGSNFFFSFHEFPVLQNSCLVMVWKKFTTAKSNMLVLPLKR